MIKIMRTLIFFRAGLRMAQKEYEAAAYDYTSVLLINPANTKVYAYRGLAEGYALDTANMRLDLNEAIKRNPKDENNYILRGKAKVSLEDVAGALKDFNTAIGINDINEEAWLSRGLVKIRLNDKSACTDLYKALALGSKEASEAISRNCKSLSAVNH